MLNRWVEDGLTDVLDKNGVGSIVFSPLAQGLLTNKYANGIPADSRAADSRSRFLNESSVTTSVVEKVKQLNVIAKNRGQSMTQLALAWVLRKERITCALIGASRPEQIIENVHTVDNLDFSDEELNLIENILKSE